jgi:hypothetical protein
VGVDVGVGVVVGVGVDVGVDVGVGVGVDVDVCTQTREPLQPLHDVFRYFVTHTPIKVAHPCSRGISWSTADWWREGCDIIQV